MSEQTWSERRLLVPSRAEPGPDGCLVEVTPENAGWRYASLRAFRLQRGQKLERQTGEEEACVVVLGGRCQASVAGRSFGEIGERATPFNGPPHALYVGPGATYRLEATTETLEMAVGSAPGRAGLEPRLIGPADVPQYTRGAGGMERRIHDILMEAQPAATLLVTEVFTPGGHWSSYPPHKHDVENLPRESYLEEIYYHRLRRPEGFAFQRVYTRDGGLDTALAVRDGDVVLVPRGYHPVSASPGYDLYYLNVMAGPVRQWRMTLDPDLAWLAP